MKSLSILQESYLDIRRRSSVGVLMHTKGGCRYTFPRTRTSYTLVIPACDAFGPFEWRK